MKELFLGKLRLIICAVLIVFISGCATTGAIDEREEAHADQIQAVEKERVRQGQSQKGPQQNSRCSYKSSLGHPQYSAYLKDACPTPTHQGQFMSLCPGEENGHEDQVVEDNA